MLDCGLWSDKVRCIDGKDNEIGNREEKNEWIWLHGLGENSWFIAIIKIIKHQMFIILTLPKYHEQNCLTDLGLVPRELMSQRSQKQMKLTINRH